MILWVENSQDPRRRPPFSEASGRPRGASALRSAAPPSLEQGSSLGGGTSCANGKPLLTEALVVPSTDLLK